MTKNLVGRNVEIVKGNHQGKIGKIIAYDKRMPFPYRIEILAISQELTYRRSSFVVLPDLLARVAIDDIGGYSTHHLMQLWGVKRARISALAKRYQWQVVGKIGQSNVYAREDVEAYMAIRKE